MNICIFAKSLPVHSMRIFVPSNTASHPYLTLLYGELKKIRENEESVKIDDIKGVIDIFKAFRADIIHIHWLEYYIRSTKGAVRTIFRFTLFSILLMLLKFLGKK